MILKVLLLCFGVILFLSFSGRQKNVADNGNTVSLAWHPLQSKTAIDSLMDQIGAARIVLLGEASHGTAEYYEWRAAISKRLIAEKGFNAIAVEGEWADSYRVNQFVKGGPKDSAQAVQLLRRYDRWPTWMWGNYHIASLVTWMNQHNQQRSAKDKAGFFGLDVYCLWESMEELMPLIQGNDSLMRLAQGVRQCFRPFSADPMQYALAVANESAECRQQTSRLYEAVMNFTGKATSRDEAPFVVQQNALVARNGERYYRASVSSYPGSWNMRDQHMQQTLERLLELHGPNSRIIVWAHNTHVGDARFTDMAAGGMINLGQLARERFGQDAVYAVGFGSYQGTVVAAREWGAPTQNMALPQAQAGSWEHLLHQAGTGDKMVFSSELDQNETLKSSIGHRAIGVVYNPSNERGNYVPTIVPRRYDAFIFIDQSTALRHLGTAPKNEPPDTYPSGY